MRTAILLPRASKPPFDVLNRKGCGAVGRRYRHAPPGYQQGYVANTKRGRGVGGVLRELQAAIPNLSSMNRACSTTAPLSNNRTGPLRVMCIASYPWIVRQAPSPNDKVQNDGREGLRADTTKLAPLVRELQELRRDQRALGGCVS